MARILLAWELGGGFGHLVPLARIGTALRDAGHECVFALRDLGAAHRLPGLREARLFQAPLFLPGRRNTDIQQRNYADLLASIGYGDAAALGGVVAGWTHLFDTLEPDLLVFDHAPTAMAAARGRGLPGIAIASSGFTVPPAVNPLPAFRDMPGTSNEERVTGNLNAVLRDAGMPRLEHLGQLLEADARLLFSIPELDVYGPREDVEYLGPLPASTGAQPSWPDGTGGKVFAYLRAFPALPALLEALAASGVPSLVHVSGVDAEECAELSRGTLVLTAEMLDIERVLADCALVISHGGSLCASALLAGIPQLTLPLHLEQHLAGTKIQSLGAGLNAPKHLPDGMRHKLDRLLHEPAFAQTAREFAAHYPRFPARPEERVAALVETLLARDS